MNHHLIIGIGFFRSKFCPSKKKQVIVIDKHNNIVKNHHTESIERINIHKYGGQALNTSNKYVWNFINSFVDFNHNIKNSHSPFQRLPLQLEK